MSDIGALIFSLITVFIFLILNKYTVITFHWDILILMYVLVLVYKRHE